MEQAIHNLISKIYPYLKKICILNKQIPIPRQGMG